MSRVGGHLDKSNRNFTRGALWREGEEWVILPYNGGGGDLVYMYPDNPTILWVVDMIIVPACF